MSLNVLYLCLCLIHKPYLAAFAAAEYCPPPSPAPGTTPAPPVPPSPPAPNPAPAPPGTPISEKWSKLHHEFTVNQT